VYRVHVCMPVGSNSNGFPLVPLDSRGSGSTTVSRNGKEMGMVTRWLYCVKCPQYSTRLEALGYMCDCLSGRV